MKELITSDGKIILSETSIETLIGSVAHSMYFNLHRLYREVYIELGLDHDIESIENSIFGLLNDNRAIELQEVKEVIIK